MEEIWKDIQGYEGLYQVSNLGNVYSLRKRGENKSIYQTITKSGYKQVKLCKDRKEKHYYVHRLVAVAFVPGYEEGKEVNHKDLNKFNNRFDNLEWVTHSENQKHQCSILRKKVINICLNCGSKVDKRNSLCILCYRNKLKVRKEASGISKENLEQDLLHLPITKIAEKYGYSDNGIRNICKEFGLPSKKEEILEFRNKTRTLISNGRKLSS